MAKLKNSLIPNMAPGLFMASLLCIALFYCAPCYSAEPEMMMVSKTQYTRLAQINSQLLAKLEMLCLQTEMLKTPSTQLVSELTEARTLLEETQKKLTISTENLKNAENLLKQAETSLMILEKKIEADKAKAQAVERRLKWQRNVAYTIGGFCAYKMLKK